MCQSSPKLPSQTNPLIAAIPLKVIDSVAQCCRFKCWCDRALKTGNVHRRKYIIRQFIPNKDTLCTLSQLLSRNQIHSLVLSICQMRGFVSFLWFILLMKWISLGLLVRQNKNFNFNLKTNCLNPKQWRGYSILRLIVGCSCAADSAVASVTDPRYDLNSGPLSETFLYVWMCPIVFFWVSLQQNWRRWWPCWGRGGSHQRSTRRLVVFLKKAPHSDSPSLFLFYFFPTTQNHTVPLPHFTWPSSIKWRKKKEKSWHFISEHRRASGIVPVPGERGGARSEKSTTN